MSTYSVIRQAFWVSACGHSNSPHPLTATWIMSSPRPCAERRAIYDSLISSIAISESSMWTWFRFIACTSLPMSIVNKNSSCFEGHSICPRDIEAYCRAVLCHVSSKGSCTGKPTKGLAIYCYRLACTHVSILLISSHWFPRSLGYGVHWGQVEHESLTKRRRKSISTARQLTVIVLGLSFYSVRMHQSM